MSDLMVRTAELGHAAEPATVAHPIDAHEWARRLDLVVESLRARLGATVEPEPLRAEVEAGFAEYATARVRDFVPALVESRVRSRHLRPADATRR